MLKRLIFHVVLISLTLVNIANAQKDERAFEKFFNTLAFNLWYEKAYYDKDFVKHESAENILLIQEFNKTILNNPNDAMAYHNRGYAKEELGDYRGAIEDLNKAIEINPELAGAYCNRGISKAKLKNYKGAIEDFNKVIELNPRYFKAYYNRGLTYYSLGEYKAAIDDFNRVIGNIPITEGNIEYEWLGQKAYLGRAASRLRMGEKDLACLDISKAGELGNWTAYETIKILCN